MRLLLTTIIFCLSVSLFSQQDTLSVMSYNVENLFDTKHDTLKNDYEYTPEGNKHWTYDKYQKKLANISKVITTVGKWKAPVLVSLIEIENEHCLSDLTQYSPLKKFHYKYIHAESQDNRGIDVALLYLPQQFKPLKSNFYTIHFPNHPNSKTRDILYAAGLLRNGDTLHVFVNHFPSRLGGEKESEEKRLYVASVLRSKVDSILTKNNKANIVIMGDFNDFPTNNSIESVLLAKKVTNPVSSKQLYNLFYNYQTEGKIGTNKYKDEWGVLDQIIVSGNLLNSKSSVCTSSDLSFICDESFLLEDDPKYLGKKPFRTYNGKKYQDGYSDHLPVYINLIIK